MYEKVMISSGHKYKFKYKLFSKEKRREGASSPSARLFFFERFFLTVYYSGYIL
jgi:hypothetical protein